MRQAGGRCQRCECGGCWEPAGRGGGRAPVLAGGLGERGERQADGRPARQGHRPSLPRGIQQGLPAAPRDKNSLQAHVCYLQIFTLLRVKQQFCSKLCERDRTRAACRVLLPPAAGPQGPTTSAGVRTRRFLCAVAPRSGPFGSHVLEKALRELGARAARAGEEEYAAIEEVGGWLWAVGGSWRAVGRRCYLLLPCPALPWPALALQLPAARLLILPL